MASSYFICATQTTNLGDLIINKMLIDELCNYGKVFVDAYNISDDFKKPLITNPNVVDVISLGFSIKRIRFYNFIKYITGIKRNKIRLITRSPGPLIGLSRKVRFGFCIVNAIGRLCGSRVVLFGNCCSEAYSKNQVLKGNFENAIYFRSFDSMSYSSKYLKSRIGFIPDLAFLLPNKSAVHKKKLVAIDYRLIPETEDEILFDIKSIVRDFIKEGYSVEIYYQVKGDKMFSEKLYQEIKQDGVIFRKEIVWYDDLDYYADKAFILSNRLHSLLFGAVYGAIPIARITDEPKLSKIEHVFKSSLNPVFYNQIDISHTISVNDLVCKYELLKSIIEKDVKENYKLVKFTINQVIEELGFNNEAQ